MRHVDDAHDAEGDGQPGGGQQQHRAEREAVERALQHGPDICILSMPATAALAAAATAGGSVTLPIGRAPPCRRGLSGRRWRPGGPARAAVPRLRIAGGAGLLHDALDARILFDCAMARSSAGRAVSSREWNTASAAAARSVGSVEKRRSAPTAPSTATRTLLLTRTALRSSLMSSTSAVSPGGSVDGAAVGLDVDGAVRADIELARLQSTQDGTGTRVARCGQRLDTLADAAEAVGGEGGQVGLGLRRGAEDEQHSQGARAGHGRAGPASPSGHREPGGRRHGARQGRPSRADAVRWRGAPVDGGGGKPPPAELEHQLFPAPPHLPILTL